MQIDWLNHSPLFKEPYNPKIRLSVINDWQINKI